MTAKSKSWTLAEIKDELARIARVGELFVEGDLCRKAWRPHAETFLRGDDMDYNPAAAVPLKKTLLRLERVGPFPCATTLWRRRPDMPEAGEPLLYGTLSSPDGIMKPPNRGYVPAPMTREMKTVFLKGGTAWKVEAGGARAVASLNRRPGVVSASVKRPTYVRRFVPVRDSLGEIAAALEVFAVVSPA